MGGVANSQDGTSDHPHSCTIVAVLPTLEHASILFLIPIFTGRTRLIVKVTTKVVVDLGPQLEPDFRLLSKEAFQWVLPNFMTCLVMSVNQINVVVQWINGSLSERKKLLRWEAKCPQGKIKDSPRCLWKNLLCDINDRKSLISFTSFLSRVFLSLSTKLSSPPFFISIKMEANKTGTIFFSGVQLWSPALRKPCLNLI